MEYDPQQLQRNLRLECVFNALNGIFMGAILYASHIIALKCLHGNQWHVTLLTCAFPCGAFLGPLWAKWGAVWGMHQLVLRMALWANLPLFLVPFVAWLPGSGGPAAGFTLLVAISQLAFSAMRMGQSSLYHATYPRQMRGKVLGWLIFWNFLTMVLAIVAMGYLVDPEWGHSPENYRWLCPLAAGFGLLACIAYAQVKPVYHVRETATTFQKTFRMAREVLRRDHAYRRFQFGYFLSGSAFFLTVHLVLVLSKQDLGFSSLELAVWLAVVPQATLAITSPFWGRLMDRLGIEESRFFISTIMTIYLICYFVGILAHLPLLIILGSVLRGVAEGGGQVTWALASVQFAPSSAEVPVYNGIHFWLNGVRGLLMPWLGTQLFVLIGEYALLAGIATSIAAMAVVVWSLRDDQHRRVSAIPALQIIEEEVDSSTINTAAIND
ncbi:MAG TPA: MFS transporter [Gemmatales bacterium]|nr:MFS transporter [Gemmatales bacterium]